MDTKKLEKVFNGKIKKLCDGDCNHCALLDSPNKKQLDFLLNAVVEVYGDNFISFVNRFCPNMTCCFNCHCDDFCHIEADEDEEPCDVCEAIDDLFYKD